VGLPEFTYESATGIKEKLLTELVLVGRVVLVAVGVLAGRFVCVEMAVGGNAVGDALLVSRTGLTVTLGIEGLAVLVGWTVGGSVFVGWTVAGTGLAVAEGIGASGPLVNWIAPMSNAGPRCLAKKSLAMPMSAAPPAAGDELEGW
jgi:hypothetical protein